jgi:hypothetical protein
MFEVAQIVRGAVVSNSTGDENDEFITTVISSVWLLTFQITRQLLAMDFLLTCWLLGEKK